MTLLLNSLDFTFLPQKPRRLTSEHPGSQVTLLNFASAKNPCGGMIKGALAQVASDQRAKISSYLDCQSSGGKHWSLLWLVKVSAIILGHILLEAQAGAKVGDFK